MTVKDDILKLIKALQADKAAQPLVMYYPDSAIIAMGGDPNDYPELEGHPGVRVVEAK